MKRLGFAVPALVVLAAASRVAASNNGFLAPVAAPTLDELGLGLLVVVLGVVGGIVLRRRK